MPTPETTGLKKKKKAQNKWRQSTVTNSIALQSVHPSYFITMLPHYQELETVLVTFDKNLN